MAETLTHFGHSFQKKIIVLLLFNRRFLQTINDILEPDYFDSDADKWLVNCIKKYYEKYKVEPTLEAIKIQVDELSSEVLKKSAVDNLREAFQESFNILKNPIYRELIIDINNIKSLCNLIWKKNNLLTRKRVNRRLAW